MKNYQTLFGLCFTASAILLMDACKKDSVSDGSSTLKEEFAQMYTIGQKGWIVKDNTSVGGNNSLWTQGYSGKDKTGAVYGMPAYSFQSSEDEYAYSASSTWDSTAIVSSWLISPVLPVKNGTSISFYTCGDAGYTYTDRMQVLISPTGSFNVGDSANTVGSFTQVLFDINAEQRPGGYPQSWTKYDYTFTGISQKTDMRIAFRHYSNHAPTDRGVGLDLFEYASH
jgi:hypothetical protein